MERTKNEMERTMNTEAAINEFKVQLLSYTTLPIYFDSGVTLRFDAYEHGFDVYINDIKFYFVGDYAYDHIHTFAYCTITIMHNFACGLIKTEG